MRDISLSDYSAVCGGATSTNAAANLEIGNAVGDTLHGLNSVESKVGGALFGAVGAVVGALIHYKRVH